jgi:hypothetical protein
MGKSMIDQSEERVIYAMKALHPEKYENLLTDNGSQFSRKNYTMKKYCEENITGRHIWTSVHHPQTMCKLSSAQKGLKRFLRHRLGRSTNMKEIDENIRAYMDFYNNAVAVSTTGYISEKRYSGSADEDWYSRLVKALKLEDCFLLIMRDRGDISVLVLHFRLASAFNTFIYKLGF